MSTWSYTIIGSSEAYKYWAKYSEFIWSFVGLNDNSSLEGVSDQKLQSIIKNRYEDIVKLAIEQKSRLAYQVLGVFLMDHGAMVTSALKELILLNSRWKDEEGQLLNESDRAERFYYLSEFCRKIRHYTDGVKTEISWESSAQVIETLRDKGLIKEDYPFMTPPKRLSIDHKIK